MSENPSTGGRPRQGLAGSFRVAMAGILHAIRTQRNSQIHAAMTGAVVVAGALLRLTPVEWCLALLCVGLVCAVELLNTALEVVVDGLSPGDNEHARVAKDVAAGAVLLSAAIAAGVGLIVFLPRVVEFVARMRNLTRVG